MWPVTRTRRTVDSGAPRLVSRWRPTNAEWHILSFNTPPPRIADLFHVLDAGVVPAAQPERVDLRVRHHLGDRAVRVRLTEVEVARQGGRLLGVLWGRAPHPAHVRIAHRLEGVQVEPRVEAAADEPDAESTSCHYVRPSPFPGLFPFPGLKPRSSPRASRAPRADSPSTRRRTCCRCNAGPARPACSRRTPRP